MKVITVFTQPIENNTSSMIRCRNVLNGIAELGHQIIAYSPHPDMNSIYYGHDITIDSNIEIRRYGKKQSETTGEKVKQRKKDSIALKLYRRFDLFGAAILYVRYARDIINQISSEKYDLIISFSGPIATHIISNKIVRKRKNLRYIQQWGDPLTADITRKSLTPKWIQHIIESRLLQIVEKVYYVSPITMRDQKELFPKYKDKMFFVPTPAKQRVYSSTVNGKLKIGYFGSYQTSARNIVPLYEASLVNKEIELLIVGDSDFNLKEADNIQLVARTTPAEIDKYMEQMDVVVCLMNSSGGQIPGKTYNYACTNKEILMLTDGERGEAIKSFFEQYNRFTFVDNNKESINKQLKRYVAMGVPIREPIEDFTSVIVAKEMMKL